MQNAVYVSEMIFIVQNKTGSNRTISNRKWKIIIDESVNIITNWAESSRNGRRVADTIHLFDQIWRW